MSALWMRLRAEARASWRAWVGLALAFGLAGGAATAAAAGARRTESAYPRFVETYEGDHVVLGGLGEDDPREMERMRREIARLPQVARASFSQFVAFSYRLADGAEVSFPETIVSGDLAGVIDAGTVKVLEGRMYEPNAPREAIVDFIMADRLGIEVGDTIDIMLLDPETFEPTVPRPVTVVGIVVVPGSMPAVGQTPFSGIAVTPGFMRVNAVNIPPNEDAPSVRLHEGDEDIPGFIAAAREIAPNVDIPFTLPRHVTGVQKTLRFDVAALWILAALLGFSALVILGQALARQIHLESAGHGALRALGMSRAQLVGADLVRALAIGVVASGAAVIVAVIASQLTPRGLARVVEPDPGIYVDWTVLAIGAATWLLVPGLASIVPSVRAARHRAERISRPSRTAAALTGAGLGPSVVTGTRLALEPGRGARAVPVRATIGGMALALAAFTTAGSFGESLEALISNPALSGFGWDLFAGSEDSVADAKVLAADPDVEVVSLGGYANVQIEGRQLIPLVYEPGTIEPTILEGRAPQRNDEIALGSGLLRSFGSRIGDRIMVAPSEQGRGTSGMSQPFTIVGRTVVPPIFFQQLEPGESSAMTLDGMFRLDAIGERDRTGVPHLIKFRQGTDIRAKVSELRATIPGLFVGQIRQPGAELSALSRSSGLPVLLTGVLLAMAVATLMHTLATSIRKRRHDLAILKTLGFVRAQVRAAVAWQASVLVAVALAVGVPVGIALGRWSWRWFANTLGVIPDPVAPAIVILVVVPIGTFVLANVIALVPAHAAARTAPAIVLRSE